MGTLKEDIKDQSDWIVEAFAADKLKLDYSISSFIVIDRFFNKHTLNGKAKKGGRLSKLLGPILFSIAAYIGETFIKNVKGCKWITDDEASDGELSIAVKFPDGSIIYPAQRVMKRFKNGVEDSIYVYGQNIAKEYIDEEFDKTYWEIIEEKAWWRFW